MGALNYIAMVIFAAIFVGIGFTLYSEYQRGAAEREFEARVELLAERVETMADQSAGTADYLEIYVPPTCELSFSDNAIFARIGSSSRNFPVSVTVVGPVFRNQRLNLKILRTDNEVIVSAA